MPSFSILINKEGHSMNMYYLYGNLLQKCSGFCPLSQLTKKFITCFITYLNVNYFDKSTIKPDYFH